MAGSWSPGSMNYYVYSLSRIGYLVSPRADQRYEMGTSLGHVNLKLNSLFLP